MNKRMVVGVIVAVLAIGGLMALAVSQKQDNTDSSKHNQSTTTTGDNKHAEDTDSSSNNQDNTAAATDQVTIENFAFGPSQITVKKGTKVTWTNKDSVAHTVTADSGQTGPDSSLISQGDSYSFTFDTVGTFTYHCKPHPNMTGTVTVTE